MGKILIISGHPDLKTSVANKTILEDLQRNLPEAQIIKLDELYPDFKINVALEQQRMLESQIIVLQYPLFWYSAPSLLQRYLEETFQYGFSHGKNGDKLKGKKLVLSFTSGALASAYTKEGVMGYTIEEFLPCFKAACKLCQIEFAGFVYTGGVSYANRNSPELIKKQKEACADHATRLINLLKSL